MDYLIVILGSASAGLILSTTGFGSAIIMMMLFPIILPITQAAALSNCISIFLTVSMVLTYRKHIRVRLLPVPLASYAVFSAVAIWTTSIMDATKLKPFLGLLLIALAIYFMIFSKRVKIKGNLPTAIGFSSFSGYITGMFAIGGPPMVLYYLAVTAGPMEYLGTLQAFFLITQGYDLIVRLLNGLLSSDLICYVLLGTVSGLAGKLIGTKLIHYIDGALMTKIIYVVIALSGIVIFSTSL